ncbi:MAG: hypothetical protein EOP04_20260, partial [Proteobacteria bacterium]
MGDFMIRLGILGVDSSHFDVFGDYFAQKRSMFQVSSVWGENLVQARDKISKFTPGAALYHSADEAVDHSDAVLVIPRFPEQHPQLASLAIRAGKRVYIDKPIGRSISDFTKELQEPSLRNLWMSFSACRFYDEVQSIQSKTASVTEIVGPFECNDLGDDIRFRDISFYGIHSIEMLLEIAQTIHFEKTGIKSIENGLRLELYARERLFAV